MRHTATPRQPEELSKLRRLADLLDQAAVAIESYLSLGEGPQDTIPLNMVALTSASDYLTESGLGPDAQQLVKLRRQFLEHLTVITGINARKNGCIASVQEFYREAGFANQLPNFDTPEQQENELSIRWSLLRDTALELRPLLRDLHAHVIRETETVAVDGTRKAPVGGIDAEAAAGNGKPNGTTPKKPGGRKQSRNRAKRTEPAKSTKRELRIDDGAKLAYWGGKRLDINSHADFAVLAALHSANGAIVSYLELLKAVKRDELSERVERLKEAPPEVKEAVLHIRAALKKVGSTLRVETVRGNGYRLRSPDE